MAQDREGRTARELRWEVTGGVEHGARRRRAVPSVKGEPVGRETQPVTRPGNLWRVLPLASDLQRETSHQLGEEGERCGRSGEEKAHRGWLGTRLLEGSSESLMLELGVDE